MEKIRLRGVLLWFLCKNSGRKSFIGMILSFGSLPLLKA